MGRNSLRICVHRNEYCLILFILRYQSAVLLPEVVAQTDCKNPVFHHRVSDKTVSADTDEVSLPVLPVKFPPTPSGHPSENSATVPQSFHIFRFLPRPASF